MADAFATGKQLGKLAAPGTVAAAGLQSTLLEDRCFCGRHMPHYSVIYFWQAPQLVTADARMRKNGHVRPAFKRRVSDASVRRLERLAYTSKCAHVVIC